MTVQSQTQKPPMVTARRVMKIIAIFIIIFCFCPSFLVSCSGTDIEVSAMDAALGMTYRGERITEAHPIMLLCLLIPVAVLVILFIIRIKDRTSAAVVTMLMAADLVLWLLLFYGVKSATEENYCTFKSTPWYMINVICIIAMIILGALVCFRKIYYDGMLVTDETAKKTREALDDVGKNMKKIVAEAAKETKMPEPQNVIGYCSKCGSPLDAESVFCTKCGTPVPADLLKPKDKEEASEELKKETSQETKEEVSEAPKEEVKKEIPAEPEEAEKHKEEKKQEWKEHTDDLQ